MVPFFCESSPYARGIVGNLNRLADGLRAAGGTTVWVLPSSNELAPSRIEFFGPDVAERYRRSGGEGELRSRLWSELAMQSGDLLLEKTAPSAFFPGSCALHEELTQLEIDTVLISGTVANVCCESTARDASTLGYRTVMVADANAALTDADLNATLHTFYRSFGDVRSTDELLALIGRAETMTR